MNTGGTMATSTLHMYVYDIHHINFRLLFEQKIYFPLRERMFFTLERNESKLNLHSMKSIKIQGQ